MVALMATLFFSLLVVRFVPDFIQARHAYRAGDNSVVEGVVENFHPAPALGPASESFSVNGINFSYNSLESASCFHNAPFQKGPITAGLIVRVTYKNSCIQRVEVRR